MFRTGGGRFAALIARGGAEAESRGHRPHPAFIAESLSRSIVAVASARVLGPEVESLPEQAVPMTGLVAGFYLGPEAAGEVLGSDS